MARHGSRHKWSGQKWDFLRAYSIPAREKALGVAKRTPAGRWNRLSLFPLVNSQERQVTAPPPTESRQTHAPLSRKRPAALLCIPLFPYVPLRLHGLPESPASSLSVYQVKLLQVGITIATVARATREFPQRVTAFPARIVHRSDEQRCLRPDFAFSPIIAM